MKIQTFFSKGIVSRDLKSLFELFLKPYIKHMYVAKDQLDIKVLIGDFFHEDTRAFIDMKAQRAFTMPGHLMHGNVILPGNQGHREVKRGHWVTVRMDTDLDYVDVQYDVHDKEQMFRLTIPQFKFILKKLNGSLPIEFEQYYSR